MKSTDAVQTGLVLMCGTAMAGAGQALRESVTAAGSRSLESLLGLALSAVGLVIVAVWLLTFALAVIAELLSRRGASAAAGIAGRCTPAVMRRLAAAVLGMNLLAVPAMAQSAPPVAGIPSGSAGAPAATAPPARGTDGEVAEPAPASPYWSPQELDRVDEPTTGRPAPSLPEPVTGAAQGATSAPSAVSPTWVPSPMPVPGGPLLRPGTRTLPDTVEVVVAPGDSIWSIVAAQLGPLATAADIAEAWPAWYDTNRAVIGHDPCLLIPGQILVPPRA